MGDEKKREEVNTFIIKRQNLNHMQELEKFQETFDEAGGGRVGVDRGDIAADTQKILKAARTSGFRKLNDTYDIINVLHRLNFGLQSQQPMFKLIEQYVKSRGIEGYSDLCHNPNPDQLEGIQLMHRPKSEIIMHCNTKGMVPGIVGEIPVHWHVAHLMGQHKLGRDMISAAATRLTFAEFLKMSTSIQVLNSQTRRRKKLSIL